MDTQGKNSKEKEEIKQYKSKFIARLAKASNQQLYLLAKKYLLIHHFAEKHSSWKLQLIQQECEKRNKKIYEDALKDALATINSLDKFYILDESKIIDIQRIDHLTMPELELYLNSVSAGEGMPTFAQVSPKTLFNDLSKYFIANNVFFCQVSGLSMTEAGIHDKSILIVEKVSAPRQNDVVVFAMDGDLFVKRYCIINNQTVFKSENEHYPDIIPTKHNNIEILGVVRYVIHKPISK